MKGKKIEEIIFRLLVDFLFSWFVMLLWNNLIIDLFDVQTITYWQAFFLKFFVEIMVKPSVDFYDSNEKLDEIIKLLKHDDDTAK